MDLEALKAEARTLERDGKLGEALEVYRRILAHAQQTGSMKRELPLYVKAGDLLLKTGDQRGGLGMYGRAARVYAEAGAARSVIALCTKIIRAAPTHSYVYVRLARMMVEHDHTQPAREVLLEYARLTRQRKGREILERLAAQPDAQVKATLTKLLEAAEKRESALAGRESAGAAADTDRESSAREAPPSDPAATGGRPPSEQTQTRHAVRSSADTPEGMPPMRSPRPATPSSGETAPRQRVSPTPSEPADTGAPPTDEPEPARAEREPEPEPVVGAWEPERTEPEPLALDDLATEATAPAPPEPPPSPIWKAPESSVEPPPIEPEPPAAPTRDVDDTWSPERAEPQPDRVSAPAPRRTGMGGPSRSAEHVVFGRYQREQRSSRVVPVVAAIVVVVGAAAALVATGIIPLGGGGATAVPPAPAPPATDTRPAVGDSSPVALGADSFAAPDSVERLDSVATSVLVDTVPVPDALPVLAAADTLGDITPPQAADTGGAAGPADSVGLRAPVVPPDPTPTDTAAPAPTPPPTPAERTLDVALPAVIVGGLEVAHAEEYASGDRNGVRVTQRTADGELLTLTTLPFQDDAAGAPTASQIRVISVPGDTSVGVVRFGRFMVNARARISPDLMDRLLRRLVLVEPRN